MVETDDRRPGRRNRRGDGLRHLPRVVARVRPDIAAALELRATATGRSKAEIVETALARELGVKGPA